MAIASTPAHGLDVSDNFQLNSSESCPGLHLGHKLEANVWRRSDGTNNTFIANYKNAAECRTIVLTCKGSIICGIYRRLVTHSEWPLYRRANDQIFLALTGTQNGLFKWGLYKEWDKQQNARAFIYSDTVYCPVGRFVQRIELGNGAAFTDYNITISSNEPHFITSSGRLFCPTFLSYFFN